MTAPTFRTPQQQVERNPWLTMRHMRRLIADKRIEYAKVGGKVLIADESIEQLIAAGLVKARTSARSLRRVS